jgi:hypothetical protein
MRWFDIQGLALGRRPAPDLKTFATARLSAGRYSIKRADFFNIQVSRDGKPLGNLRSPIPKDRIYSYSILGGDRILLGCGSSGIYLVDLATGKLLRTFNGHSGMVTGLAPSPDDRHFLSGSADQTLCVWSPDHDRPLLSLFVAGQDWVLWSPEGLYAASAYGERLMGWQINRGAGELALYYPAGQFRLSLYHPDVVSRIVSEGGLAQALARTGKQRLARTGVDKVLPPQVAIRSPARSTRLARGQVELEVEAVARSVGAEPVLGLRLLLDGRPYQGEAGARKVARPQVGLVKASWSVRVPAGRHSLMVQAESAVSKSLSAAVEVVSPVADPGPPALYILAVGVSAYPGRLKLNYAAADAQALVPILHRRSAGTFSNVEWRLLTDAKATKANIGAGLTWLRQKMTPRDVAVVFLSGHGANDRGMFYYLPVDVRMDDVRGTSISGEELKQAVGALPGRVVLMLDACHSGAATVAAVARPPTDDLARDLVTDDYGVVVMCSSLGHQVSLESPLLKHGFFTYAFLEGLNGKADFNNDRLIHLHELDYYTVLRVRQLSGNMQTPTTGRPPNIRSFVLGRY